MAKAKRSKGQAAGGGKDTLRVRASAKRVGQDGAMFNVSIKRGPFGSMNCDIALRLKEPAVAAEVLAVAKDAAAELNGFAVGTEAQAAAYVAKCGEFLWRLIAATQGAAA